MPATDRPFVSAAHETGPEGARCCGAPDCLLHPHWSPETDPPPRHDDGLGWLRLALRAVPLVAVIYGGLLLTLVLRIVERPLCGLARPITPRVTVVVCRVVLWILGLRLRVQGRAMTGPGAIVANHASWLDIFVLNAIQPVYFVAKSEVSRWPGIGVLARVTGTVFIARKGTEALAQKALFEARLRAGHRLLFFPEGTSSDGLRVLPFKTPLFAAFFADSLKDGMAIQPVTVAYRAGPGRDPRFYGWWGAMGFLPHLIACLKAPAGSVAVVLHPPRPVAEHAGRKALAAACEADVRSVLPALLHQ